MSDPAKDVISFYERHANEFNQHRGRTLIEKSWLDRFLDIAPIKADILDIGCGMGQPIAAYFIDAGYSVTGIDSSAPMINICLARFPYQKWHVQDMRTVDLDRKYDAIIAWDSFFHLNETDQIAMFRVFAKHARNGAPLMFTAGPAHGEATNPLWGDLLFHYSLSLEEYRAQLEENGFKLVDYIHEDLDCGGRSVYLAQKSD